MMINVKYEDGEENGSTELHPRYLNKLMTVEDATWLLPKNRRDVNIRCSNIYFN